MRAGVTEVAGVSGAVLAALCCAGNAAIVGALSAVGLGFLRQDRILWPVMLGSLAVALWGLWQTRAKSPRRVPLLLGSVSAVALAAGVIFIHGPPAMVAIYGGSLGLLVSILLNARASQYRAPPPPG